MTWSIQNGKCDLCGIEVEPTRFRLKSHSCKSCTQWLSTLVYRVFNFVSKSSSQSFQFFPLLIFSFWEWTDSKSILLGQPEWYKSEQQGRQDTCISIQLQEPKQDKYLQGKQLWQIETVQSSAGLLIDFLNQSRRTNRKQLKWLVCQNRTSICAFCGPLSACTHPRGVLA